MIPFVDIGKEFELLRNEIFTKLNKVLFSSQFILGEEVEKFEENVANMLGTKYAIGVGSGTDALYFTLKSIGIGKGDEVITTPFSFIASTSAIIRTGAVPVFADIDSETFNINPENIEKLINEKTKAILIVHLFGNPCKMDKIIEIARKHKLKLIEDCAQSFGSKYKEKFVGTFGDAGCLSFYPSKNLGAYGDAGMIVTNSEDIATKCKLLRNHGLGDSGKYELIGFNSRLDSIQAAILNVKIEYFNHIIDKKRRLAKIYLESFKDMEEIIPQEVTENSFHTYCILTMRVKKRDKLKEYLNENGFSCAVYYPLPIPEQPCMKSFNIEPKSYYIASNISKHVLSFPIYSSLSEESVKNIIDKTKEFYAS